ncbi:MAG: response regulator [Bacteroidales bacterium]|jgi:CheY-like chemotaxis protein|nr:response regulator [Bacteroidales bacterium]
MHSDQHNLDLSGKTIAIVDDDMATIRYFEILLKTTSAEVMTFLNAIDFLNYSKENPRKFDLVLMDYLIPYINGIDCVKSLRKYNRHVPVVMITAYYTRESKEESILAGIDEYILKPIIPEKVLSILEKYLTRKEYSYK